MGLRFPIFAWLFAAALAVESVVAIRAADPDPAKLDAASVEFFEAKIRPVLVTHCYECHSASTKEPKGKLLLDSRAGMLKGGESGTLVIPGNVDGSLLIQALRYQGAEMPPKGKLPADTVADFEKWVKMGLPDPRDGKVAAGRTIDIAEGRKFWSFQPIAKVEPPAVKEAGWVKNDIDRFVLARLEASGLKPNAPAAKTALLRRASFDLIGLPPTPEEIAQFLADDSANAFEKVIDRLLASKHYGERWGRHWLDVARFGEDQAHTFQARMYPAAFRYRDWIVDSLNGDLPFDQFLATQIAGDLLGEEATKKERVAALGLFALGPVYYADNNAAKQAEADEWDDRVDTMTRGVLGLTVACARCHDHKYDPVTTRDYYALAGIFASTKYQEVTLGTPEEIAKKEAADAALKAQQKVVDDFLDGKSSQVRESLATEISAYLVGAWKHVNRRKKEARFPTGESAKRDKLQEVLLRRFQEYLNGGAGKDQPKLAPWRDLVAKQDPAKDLSDDEAALAAMRSAADAFQQAVLSALAASKEKDAKPSKEDKSLLDSVVGNNGVLAIPRNELEKFVGDEVKKELKVHQDELGRVKKAADAVKLPVAHSISEGKPTDLKIFAQGNPYKPGDTSPRGFLSALTPDTPVAIASAASGRLELAKAVTSPANPLTPRVAVNRIWAGHFGYGLVRTPSNFGTLGERPTHPELLDYLARSLIDDGWSLKKLHKRIMMSATYQQSSLSDAAREQADPENRLLSRMNRRRLEVEPWRDSMLAAAGTLDLTLGGPSANLAQGDFRRRTLYGYVSRHQLHELLRLFDFPDPNITSDRRTVTTVPLQQLFVLNSDFLAQQAKSVVARVKKEAEASGQGKSDSDQIRRIYLLLFARSPSDKELAIGQAFVTTPSSGSLNAWEEYALALLGSNEFAFVD